MNFPELPGDVFESGILFDTADVELPELDASALSDWLSAVAKTYGHRIERLVFVLCSDVFLLKMNQERLDHDTYTDIITFDLRDRPDAPIEGECYISLERVNDNASRFGESRETELHRVLVHGLLHLCGLGDKTSEEAEFMRSAEDKALSLLAQ